MTNVTMPRPEGTQTRTFQWSGTDLASATNPENGTVAYTYDGAHHVLKRTDAKGQVTGYTYDAYGRLTAIDHYAPGNYPDNPDPNSHVSYGYDNGCGYSYTCGRLTSVAFKGGNISTGPLPFTYTYDYNSAGRVVTQGMQVQSASVTARYAWDTEGRMTSVTYPCLPACGYQAAFTYDTMGHRNGLSETDPGGFHSVTASAVFGLAGEIDSLTYAAWDGNFWTNYHRFSYNSLWQMTGDGVMQYVYTAGQNNGRISQSIDNLTGQTVNYTYDSLNRLSTAAATNGSWGQAYSYDSFGNLTAKTVTAGSAMHFSAAYDANNHQIGVGMAYDANGNALTGPADPNTGEAVQYTYDMENRVATAGDSQFYYIYAYDPQNKRVLQETSTYNNGQMSYSYRFFFYGIDGKLLATGVGSTQTQTTFTPVTVDFGTVRYGGQLTDRLGTARSGNGTGYFPWGEPQSGNPGAGRVFTYMQDMPGQDYADRRYYNANAGRFYTPDPSPSPDLSNPTSWSLYTYVNDDPVNSNDPTGTVACFNCPNAGGDSGNPEWWCTGPGDYFCFGGDVDPTGGFSGRPSNPLQPGGWIYDAFDDNCQVGTIDGTFAINCPFGSLLAPRPDVTTLSQLIRALPGLLGNAIGAVVLGILNPKPLSGIDEECWEQYQRDLDICRQLHQASCYDQAAQRYAACLRGRDLPPFPYYPPVTPPQRPTRPPRRNGLGTPEAQSN